MEIKNIKVADIIPYAKNQKKHPDSQVKTLQHPLKNMDLFSLLYLMQTMRL